MKATLVGGEAHHAACGDLAGGRRGEGEQEENRRESRPSEARPAFLSQADPGRSPAGPLPFVVNLLSVLKLGRFRGHMYLIMLVDDCPKSKIRVGAVWLSHKAGYGIAIRPRDSGAAPSRAPPGSGSTPPPATRPSSAGPTAPPPRTPRPAPTAARASRCTRRTRVTPARKERVGPGEPQQTRSAPQGVDPRPEFREVDRLDRRHPRLERVIGEGPRHRRRHRHREQLDGAQPPRVGRRHPDRRRALPHRRQASPRAPAARAATTPAYPAQRALGRSGCLYKCYYAITIPKQQFSSKDGEGSRGNPQRAPPVGLRPP